MPHTPLTDSGQNMITSHKIASEMRTQAGKRKDTESSVQVLQRIFFQWKGADSSRIIASFDLCHTN